MSAQDIFKTSNAYAHYAVELQVRSKLIGGIPKDPDTIKKWLQSRLDMDDRAVVELAEETAAQMQAKNDDAGDAIRKEIATIQTRLDSEEWLAAEAAMALEQRRDRLTGELDRIGKLNLQDVLTETARQFEGGNGFKTVNGNLVYEGRCMKSALKESANIAYPGSDFPGKSAFPKQFRKGLLAAFVERVFVVDEYIPLGVAIPSGTEQRIKHVMTPQGPRSAINVVDYVDKPRLQFTVRVFQDFLPQEVWGRIWQAAEEVGIGADRARSDGRFDLTRWERV